MRSPLWTLRCRRRFDTTEKLRPHPGTSQANAEKNLISTTSNSGRQGRLTLLAGVTVHVSLQRAWSRESLIADLALVLLLRI